MIILLRKSDLEREKEIRTRLKCEVYNISEKDFLKNPQLIIDEFKKFIIELTKGEKNVRCS